VAVAGDPRLVVDDPVTISSRRKHSDETSQTIDTPQGGA
jgi:hypothetical protein